VKNNRFYVDVVILKLGCMRTAAEVLFALDVLMILLRKSTACYPGFGWGRNILLQSKPTALAEKFSGQGFSIQGGPTAPGHLTESAEFSGCHNLEHPLGTRCSELHGTYHDPFTVSHAMHGTF
jgi:hypothetical protein